MSGLSDLTFELMPNLLGLLIVFYALYLTYKTREDFLSVMRGWVLAIYVVVVALQWGVELGSDSFGTLSTFDHAMIDLGYVVITSWLAVWIVSLTTVHKRTRTMGDFEESLRKKPANVISIMGAIALSYIAVILSAGGEVFDTPEWDLLLASVGVYVALSIGIIAVMVTADRKERALPGISMEGGTGLGIVAVALAGIPAAELFFDLTVNVTWGFADFNPYAWVMVVLFAIVVRSMSSEQFVAIVVNPEIESTSRSGYRAFDIPRGIYLIEDEKPDAALRLFAELVSLPLRPDIDLSGREESPAQTLEFLIPKGLAITREFPDNVRKDYGLHVTPIIWLTETPGDRRIAPTSVAVLTDTMTRFMEANPNSVTLLQGLEYLTTFNEFRRIMKALDVLNETAWVTKARVIISVNPRAFSSQEVALLERDRTVLRGAAPVDALKRESIVESVPRRNV